MNTNTFKIKLETEGYKSIVGFEEFPYLINPDGKIFNINTQLQVNNGNYPTIVLHNKKVRRTLKLKFAIANTFKQSSHSDFKVILDFPHYSINRNGDIFNEKTQKIINNSGSPTVCLSHYGTTKTFWVHKIISEYFYNPDDFKYRYIRTQSTDKYLVWVKIGKTKLYLKTVDAWSKAVHLCDIALENQDLYQGDIKKFRKLIMKLI